MTPVSGALCDVEDNSFNHPRTVPAVRLALRLTLGPRWDGDRWVVAHGHHSFALA